MNLQTNRLYIRPIKQEDKEALFAYRSNPEISQYLSWVPEKLEDAEEFIAKCPEEMNLPDTWYQLVLIDKESGQMAGDIGVHFLEDNRQVELGYTLNPAFHGKGYATEALRKVIDHMFHELDKHRIMTSIDPDNAASIKLVERLGFRKEAHFVESLYWKGQWVDDVIYAILKREWK